MIKATDKTWVLRGTLAIILFMHSIPGMLDGGVNDFGKLYLDPIGFAPFGLALAWAIKISHVVCAVLFVINRYIIPAALVTIAVLVMGIIMIHFEEGWYVVGGGRNGMEFNILMISVMVYLIMLTRK